MTYENFFAAVSNAGWTSSQLRCDEPPAAELLEFMDKCGLDEYESYVQRWLREKAGR